MRNGVVQLTYNGAGPIPKRALGFILGFLSLKGDLQTLSGGRGVAGGEYSFSVKLHPGQIPVWVITFSFCSGCRTKGHSSRSKLLQRAPVFLGRSGCLQLRARKFFSPWSRPLRRVMELGRVLGCFWVRYRGKRIVTRRSASSKSG